MGPIKAAVFDIDGTVIKGFTEYYFYRYLFRERKITPLAFFKGAISFLLFKLGLLSIDSLRSDYANATEGFEVLEFDRLVEQFFAEQIGPRIFPEIKEIISANRKDGFKIILSTAAFDRIARGYIGLLKADHLIATGMEAEDGKLSGRVIGAINYGENKRSIMTEFIKSYNVDAKNSRAYANDISDLSLLQLFGDPVACNPDARLRKIAKQKGWEIRKFH